MRILVTGGNGSVGQGLIPHLLARGHHVVVLDTELGAVRAIAHPQFAVVSGGVEDAAAVAEATRGDRGNHPPCLVVLGRPPSPLGA